MISKALSGIPDYAFVILLAHHPEFFEEAIEHKIPLTLSGHTMVVKLYLWVCPVSANGHSIYKRALRRRTKRYATSITAQATGSQSVSTAHEKLQSLHSLME